MGKVFIIDFSGKTITSSSHYILEAEIKITSDFATLLNTYLFEDNLTSQVDGVRTHFTTSFHFYTDKIFVWVNGLKEEATIINDNLFQLDTPPTIEMSLEVMYIRKA